MLPGKTMHVHAVGRGDVPPLEVPARFKTEIVFFMTPAGEPGVPPLGEGEYWIEANAARRWLDDQVIRIVSPLDAENMAEIELTEYHEAFLEWLVKHQLCHVRLG